MKAFYIDKPFECRFGSCPEPSVGAGEIRVRIKKIGLCGSDLNTFRGKNPLVQYPRIPILPHYYKDYDVPLLCTIDNGAGAESFDWIDDIIDNKMKVDNGCAYPRQTPGWGFEFLHKFMSEV